MYARTNPQPPNVGYPSYPNAPGFYAYGPGPQYPPTTAAPNYQHYGYPPTRPVVPLQALQPPSSANLQATQSAPTSQANGLQYPTHHHATESQQGNEALTVTAGSSSNSKPNSSSQTTNAAAETSPRISNSRTKHPLLNKLASMNEQTWIQMAQLSENMNEPDSALSAYESALRHNPFSAVALKQAGAICRTKELYTKGVEFFERFLRIEAENGEIWGALGHCYLMLDDLQKAYSAYQQALYHLPNPKEPTLWYGIGILYDRYGSYDHAEEAFSAVIRMDPKFEKANEIYFRLGIIYKQQSRYDLSLQCFRYILTCPPHPLTTTDIYYQIGQIHHLKKEYDLARESFERVLTENPSHAKVLQQMGWLQYTQRSLESAIAYLNRSLDSEKNDGLTWYLLGRCYMATNDFSKAYESYDNAVHKEPRNPIFWCSIGILYFTINQFIDALNAYKMAINCNRFLSEVWFNLGILYDSCRNQVQDAIDAYQMAAELDPSNAAVKQRIDLLREQQRRGGQMQLPPPPNPVQPNPTEQPPSSQQSRQAQPLQPPPHFSSTTPQQAPSAVYARGLAGNPAPSLPPSSAPPQTATPTTLPKQLQPTSRPSYPHYVGHPQHPMHTSSQYGSSDPSQQSDNSMAPPSSVPYSAGYSHYPNQYQPQPLSTSSNTSTSHVPTSTAPPNGEKRRFSNDQSGAAEGAEDENAKRVKVE